MTTTRVLDPQQCETAALMLAQLAALPPAKRAATIALVCKAIAQCGPAERPNTNGESR